jgi:hypothetical protein
MSKSIVSYVYATLGSAFGDANMPDRVVLSTSVPKAYQHVLMQVNNLQDPESIRDTFLRNTTKELKQNGQSGDELIERALPRFELLKNSSLLFGIASYNEEYAFIEKLVSKISGNRHHLYWAADAVRQVLLRMEHGEHIDNVELEIYRERMCTIFDANIADSQLGNGNYPHDRLARQNCIDEVRFLLRQTTLDQLSQSRVLSNDDPEIDILKV